MAHQREIGGIDHREQQKEQRGALEQDRDIADIAVCQKQHLTNRPCIEAPPFRAHFRGAFGCRLPFLLMQEPVQIRVELAE